MRSRSVRSFNGPPSTLPFAQELYSTTRQPFSHFPLELGVRAGEQPVRTTLGF